MIARVACSGVELGHLFLSRYKLQKQTFNNILNGSFEKCQSATQVQVSNLKFEIKALTKS